MSKLFESKGVLCAVYAITEQPDFSELLCTVQKPLTECTPKVYYSLIRAAADAREYDFKFTAINILIVIIKARNALYTVVRVSVVVVVGSLIARTEGAEREEERERTLKKVKRSITLPFVYVSC